MGGTPDHSVLKGTAVRGLGGTAPRGGYASATNHFGRPQGQTAFKSKLQVQDLHRSLNRGARSQAAASNPYEFDSGHSSARFRSNERQNSGGLAPSRRAAQSGVNSTAQRSLSGFALPGEGFPSALRGRGPEEMLRMEKEPLRVGRGLATNGSSAISAPHPQFAQLGDSMNSRRRPGDPAHSYRPTPPT